VESRFGESAGMKQFASVGKVPPVMNLVLLDDILVLRCLIPNITTVQLLFFVLRCLIPSITTVPAAILPQMDRWKWSVHRAFSFVTLWQYSPLRALASYIMDTPSIVYCILSPSFNLHLP
jgi:hypothetical protein